MGANNKTYEMLVGLYVTDDERYSRYREAMTPILEGYGGSFRYDFTIGEVLKSESAQPINRLFILTFPDVRSKDGFFASGDQLAEGNQELFLLQKQADGEWKIARYIFATTNPPKG